MFSVWCLPTLPRMHGIDFCLVCNGLIISMLPNVLQNMAFGFAKSRVWECKRWPFAVRKATFWATVNIDTLKR